VVYQDNEKAPTMGRTSIPVGHAVRWIAHEATDELASLYALNRAKNYDEYVKALVPYGCPAHNIVFASNPNDVAIWVNGKFPLKWKEQGKYILDGSNPAHDWQGWIPQAQNPHTKNPARGYVSSANQFSVDPNQYPYYLHWQFAPANRSRRINERLDKMTKVTVDSLRMLQFDNLNIDARTFMPMLLKGLKANELSAAQQAGVKLLETWDYHNEVGKIAPTIFETWMTNISNAVWADELNSTDSLPLRKPSEYRTMVMIEKQPTAKWFDNITTKDKVETLNDVLQSSFRATIDTLIKNQGPVNPKWEWQNYKNTTIGHLIPTLKAFSRDNIQVGGGSRIVNATTNKTGPSWRMVVELHPEGPKAYGLYPGGQSGNPGSPYYDNMINKWAKGELNELVFMKKKDEKNARITSTLKIEPKKP
jgi:penicillin amidase